MFKQTEHDKLLHGTLEKPELPPSVESSDSEVWSTLRLLMRTLNAKNTKREKYDKADVWRDWARLFDALGGRGPGHVGDVFLGWKGVSRCRGAGVGGVVDGPTTTSPVNWAEASSRDALILYRCSPGLC